MTKYRFTDATEFAQTFYNIGDRTLFCWKAGNYFGHHSFKYRVAVAAWDEIQADMEVVYEKQ